VKPDRGRATKIVTVAAYATTIEAQRVADALRLEGIEAEVWDSEASTTGFGAQPTVRVVVESDRLAEAREVVRRVERGEETVEVDEEELSRLALDPSHRDAEHAEDPGEDDDFVDVVGDMAKEGERYARITRTLAFWGIVFLPALVAALVRLARRPAAGLRFSEKARRTMGQARAGTALAIVVLGIFVFLVVPRLAGIERARRPLPTPSRPWR